MKDGLVYLLTFRNGHVDEDDGSHQGAHRLQEAEEEEAGGRTEGEDGEGEEEELVEETRV